VVLSLAGKKNLEEHSRYDAHAGILAIREGSLRAQKGDEINAKRTVVGSDGSCEGATKKQDSHLRSDVHAKATAA
jgi:hypothetical protein